MTMTHQEKIEWMEAYANKNEVTLELEGECGLWRECVGILKSGNYPDYAWYDKDYEQIDKNGDVWTPEDAYHKHPCVAVLGRGKGAEAQLFDWLKWFDENNFKIETGSQPVKHQIELLMGKGRFVRMVKQKEAR
jgi:hypothetical protein